MMLNQPTFVLQRRINQTLDAVERVLCDPTVLRAGSVFDLDPDGTHLRLDAPFGVMFPPFGVERASWSAPAVVRTRRNRRLLRFELEINVWDSGSTELLVRPQARHPYRWSARRVRRYFRLAHTTADTFTRLLASRALLIDLDRQFGDARVRAGW